MSKDAQILIFSIAQSNTATASLVGMVNTAGQYNERCFFGLGSKFNAPCVYTYIMSDLLTSRSQCDFVPSTFWPKTLTQLMRAATRVDWGTTEADTSIATNWKEGGTLHSNVIPDHWSSGGGNAKFNDTHPSC